MPTPITEAVLDFGAPTRLLYGLRSPYTRQVIVDTGEKGDFETLQDALAYVNPLASIGVPYLIDLRTPNTNIVDVGDFTLNAGVWLRGQGRQQTLLRGTPTMRCGSRMIGLRWSPTPGSATILHYVNDLDGHRAVLDGCYGYLEKNLDGTIFGVKCTGTIGIGMEFINSKLYLANRIASGASAHMVMFHLETGTTTYIHFADGILKTSSGATGVAVSPELVWNQGQGVDAYVEVTAPWHPFYATSPRRLRSENLLHPGGDFAMDVRLDRSLPDARVQEDITAFAGRPGADLYGGFYDRLEARSLSVGGVDLTPPLPTYAVHGEGPTVGSGRMLYDEAITDRVIATGDWGDGRDYHAFPGATLLPSGDLLVVYRSGFEHGAVGDKGIIHQQRSSDYGRTWTDPVLVYEHATHDARDPHVSVTGAGTLVLTFFLSSFPLDGLGYTPDGVRVMRSSDEGATWGAPITVDTLWTNRASTSDAVLQLANGHLLLTVYGNDAPGVYSAGVVRSTDDGLTWSAATVIGNGAVRDYNEAGIIETVGGTVLCVMRNSVSVEIPTYYKSVSNDSGVTWSTPTLLFERASGTPKMIRMDNGGILIVYRRTGVDTSVFGLAVTFDGGGTWTAEQLLTIPNSGGTDYHAPVELRPGIVALVYAYRNVATTTADVRVNYLLYRTITSPNGDDARGLMACRTFYHSGEGSAIFAKGLFLGGPRVGAGGGDGKMLFLTNGAGPTTAPVGGIAVYGESDRFMVRRPADSAGKYVALLNSTLESPVVRVEKTVSSTLYKQVLLGTTSVGATLPSLNNRRGITLSQEDMTVDDEGLTIKRWNIAHGITYRGGETDTVGALRTANLTNGGLILSGLGLGVQNAMWMEAVTSGTPASGSAPNTSVKGVMHLESLAWSGGVAATITGTQRVMTVGTNNVTLLILTGDGDMRLHKAGGGLIVTSPDGTKRMRLSVTDAGTFSSVLL